jgi:hypothetical protein
VIIPIAQIFGTRVHLLKSFLRRNIAPRRCRNILRLGGLLEAHVFQPPHHIEAKVSAAAIQVRLIPSESLSRLFRLGRNGN